MSDEATPYYGVQGPTFPCTNCNRPKLSHINVVDANGVVIAVLCPTAVYRDR